MKSHLLRGDENYLKIRHSPALKHLWDLPITQAHGWLISIRSFPKSREIRTWISFSKGPKKLSVRQSLADFQSASFKKILKSNIYLFYNLFVRLFGRYNKIKISVSVNRFLFLFYSFLTSSRSTSKCQFLLLSLPFLLLTLLKLYLVRFYILIMDEKVLVLCAK